MPALARRPSKNGSRGLYVAEPDTEIAKRRLAVLAQDHGRSQKRAVAVTSRELQLRVQAATQRRALQHALTAFEVIDLLPVAQPLIVGQAAADFVNQAMTYSATGIREGRTMPDGYTLTVCYGETSLLPKVPMWVSRVQHTATYVVGMNWLETGAEHRFTRTALMKVEGSAVAQMLRRVLARTPTEWPWQFFWVEEAFATGVIFDEFAGTPHDPPGADDKRIFEVACW